MAHYLITAKPIEERLPDLRARLDAGEVRRLEPFGRTLHESLDGARRDEVGRAVWEEEDYCSPPLAAEREAVLDDHFTEIDVEPVEEGAGWKLIESLPSLWADRS